MPLPIYTSNEKPETNPSVTAQPSSQVSNQDSQMASTNSQRTKSEAELAAEKLYEERIEEEYAKREGGAWIIVEDKPS